MVRPPGSSPSGERPHPANATPSRWVTRFLPLVPPGGTVLDVAAGSGRHTRLALGRGLSVWAVDRAVDGLADIADSPGCTVVAADLEDGSPWPLPGLRFDAVVVTDYLYRPLLPRLVDAVAPGGVLIYETFGLGNAAFGRPSNPDFLLHPGELCAAIAGALTVLAYKHGEVDDPRPAIRQRICAWHATGQRPPRLPLPDY